MKVWGFLLIFFGIIIGWIVAIFFTVILFLSANRLKVKAKENEEKILSVFKSISLEKKNTLQDIFNLSGLIVSCSTLGFCKSIIGFYNDLNKLVGLGYARLQGISFTSGRQIKGTLFYRDNYHEIVGKIQNGIIMVFLNNKEVGIIDLPGRKILDMKKKIIGRIEVLPLIPEIPFVNVYWNIYRNNELLCQPYAIKSDWEAIRAGLRTIKHPEVAAATITSLKDLVKLEDEKMTGRFIKLLQSNSIPKDLKLPLFSKKHVTSMTDQLAVLLICISILTNSIGSCR